VVRAFDGVTDDGAAVQRAAPVQAPVEQDSWSSVGGAERDQPPAEQRHLLGVLEVDCAGDRVPVATRCR
jgi:hypothetical protein